MLVLEIVLAQLLLACALALMCILQLCLYAFALRAGNWAWHPGGTHPWRGAAWSKLEVACRPLPPTHG